MPYFLLQHHHEPSECFPVAAALARAERAPVPLRDGACDHDLIWLVDAVDPADAVAQLPASVADRTTVRRVRGA